MNQTETKSALSENFSEELCSSQSYIVTFHIYNNDGNVKEENKWYLQFIHWKNSTVWDVSGAESKEINKTKPPTIFDQFNANVSKEKESKSSA